MDNEVMDDADDFDLSSTGLEPLSLQLDDIHQGDRLDKVLATLLPQFSRARLQQWIEEGWVLVDGKPAKIRTTVLGGESVTVEPQAADHDQAFPDLPDHANINFRELFKSGLVTSEDMFAVPGDGWCLPGKPDHDTGTAPDFAKALEPGEQSTGYVAGLETASNSLLPLVFYQPSPGQEVQRWISVTGSAKIAPFSPKSLGQDWDELQKQLRLPALPAKP
jgi:hypothetical protein